MKVNVFFFQAEDGIRDLVRSRGLGDVYKRQHLIPWFRYIFSHRVHLTEPKHSNQYPDNYLQPDICLLYTSDAADDLLCVDLGGRRIIKKKNQ